MTVWQQSVYRPVKAKRVSETIQEEHVVGRMEWAEGEALENIHVTWLEKLQKRSRNVWYMEAKGLELEK